MRVSMMLLSLLVLPPEGLKAQCPNAGASKGCGSVITITDSKTVVFATGQPAYDGATAFSIAVMVPSPAI